MNPETFQALIVEEGPDQTFSRRIREKQIAELPEGEVLVQVAYSSLNYKDALSAVGNRGVTRSYPHTPGIDAAGTVADSDRPEFKPGDPVIVTSYDLGMNTAGGFGQYIRVPGDWVVPLPKGLSLKESMMLGTAGFTAGLSVHHLSHTLGPEAGDILVTGASGGVGSLAVAILSKLGYAVTGVSGKPTAVEYLKNLGAKAVISREEATDTGKKPLLKARWAGVVDTVGGDILATAIKSTSHFGTVTCCGNAASPDLPLTVFPFILRGVRLIGIDSQNCPMATRRKVWQKLAGEWKPDPLKAIATEIALSELNENIDAILQGGQQGRKVVKVA